MNRNTLKLGDLKDGNIHWQFSRITKLHSGSDSITRTVTVWNAKRIIRRVTVKLYPWSYSFSTPISRMFNRAKWSKLFFSLSNCFISCLSCFIRLICSIHYSIIASWVHLLFDLVLFMLWKILSPSRRKVCLKCRVLFEFDNLRVHDQKMEPVILGHSLFMLVQIWHIITAKINDIFLLHISR